MTDAKQCRYILSIDRVGTMKNVGDREVRSLVIDPAEVVVPVMSRYCIDRLRSHEHEKKRPVFVWKGKAL